MRTVTSYSQYDPRWKDTHLGSSGLTMGGFGCYTTMVAAGISSYFLQPVTPGSLAIWLSGNMGYDQDGQLIWSAIARRFPGVELVKAEWTTNIPSSSNYAGRLSPQKALADIKAANDRGMVVGICVDNVPGGPAPDHIVLAHETSLDVNEWTIMDPDGGQVMRYKDKYGDPVKTIMGYRILVGTPANWPDYVSPQDKAIGQALGYTVDRRFTKKDIQNLLLSA